MRKRLQVVGMFASIGFILPWVLVAFYAIAHRFGGNPSTKPLLYLCPSSIISSGLDNVSLLVGLLGWLLISVSNGHSLVDPRASCLIVGWLGEVGLIHSQNFSVLCRFE
jgi:hypothetical protein